MGASSAGSAECTRASAVRRAIVGPTPDARPASHHRQPSDPAARPSHRSAPDRRPSAFRRRSDHHRRSAHPAARRIDATPLAPHDGTAERHSQDHRTAPDDAVRTAAATGWASPRLSSAAGPASTSGSGCSPVRCASARPAATHFGADKCPGLAFVGRTRRASRSVLRRRQRLRARTLLETRARRSRPRQGQRQVGAGVFSGALRPRTRP